MKTVFFTGHRIFKASDETIGNLVAVLIKLISEGSRDFYAGGSIGLGYALRKSRFEIA